MKKDNLMYIGKQIGRIIMRIAILSSAFFLISFLMEYFFEFRLISTLEIIGLILIVIGLFSIFGNTGVRTNTNLARFLVGSDTLNRNDVESRSGSYIFSFYVIISGLILLLSTIFLPS